AILHLLYSRFITKVLFDEGLVPQDEPFRALFTQGMVQRRVVTPLEMLENGHLSAPESLCKSAGLEASEMPREAMEKALRGASQQLIELDDGQLCARSGPVTMSKSSGNGVPMGPFIREHGSDVARITILFAAPPENNMEWSDEGVGGAERFLSRITALVGNDRDALATLRRDEAAAVAAVAAGKAADEADLVRALHQAVQKVSQDLEKLAFNTAIAALMEFLNYLQKDRAARVTLSPAYAASVGGLVQLLAPFAPHLAEELHVWLGGEGSIFDAGWPVWSDAALAQDSIEIVLQINGKVRDRFQVVAGISGEELEAAGREHERVVALLDGAEIRKVIVVPGRLVNVVVG
ncbi:MAG: class I tRNA ligase family protein, partial [bacterium]